MGFWKNLLDKENETVSTTNFYVIVMSIVAVILLMMPVFIFCLEAYYNHTVATDLSGMAAYIGSVSSLIIGVGLAKAWTVNSDNKLKQKIHECNTNSEDVII